MKKKSEKPIEFAASLDENKTVINIAKVQKLISGESLEGRNNTVLEPSAQTNILCCLATDPKLLSNLAEEKLNQLAMVSAPLAYIFQLQYMHGLRISEVLQIQSKDIDKLGRIRIKALKGSESRLIVSDYCKSYMLHYKSINQPPFRDYDRFFVYRVYKKIGWSFNFGTNKKASVTHAGRHLSALESKSEFNDSQLTQRHLGHKNIKNTHVYEK